MSDIKLSIVQNYWHNNNGHYEPFICVELLNVGKSNITSAKVNCIFYSDDSVIWGESSTYIVDSYDTALKPAYSKKGFLNCSVGYSNKINTCNLPLLFADIYYNNEYFGSVKIENSYNDEKDEYPIIDKKMNSNNNYTPKNKNDFYCLLRANYWKEDDGFYSPYLKILVTNQLDSPATSISIKVVFYREDNKGLWGEESYTLISQYSNTPLPQGYSKEAFIKLDHGYRSKLDIDDLPDISADIYINNTFYGNVNIEKTYNYSVISQVVRRRKKNITKNEFQKIGSKPLYPKITANYWKKSSNLYVPYIRLEVKNQSGHSIKEIKCKIIYHNDEEHSIWDEKRFTLIDDTNIPLKKGYHAFSFVYGNVGYGNKFDSDYLPKIRAELYINDEYYGYYFVEKTFDDNYQNCELYSEKLDLSKSFTPFNNNQFYATVTQRYWRYKEALPYFGGSSLYVPNLAIDILNQEEKPVDNLDIKAVFYDEDNKCLWDECSTHTISTSDTPLKQGIKKTVFLKAGVGYDNKIDESSLPEIQAEIYINKEYYGIVTIDKSYTQNDNLVVLDKLKNTSPNSYHRKNNMDFYPIIKRNGWEKNQNLYVPTLVLDITNQNEEYTKQLKIRIIFYDDEKKSVWDERTYNSIGSYDTPLKTGYCKKVFGKSNVGYENQINQEYLPHLSADVYINEKFYGSVVINNSYDKESFNIPLIEKYESKTDSNDLSWKTKSFLGELGYSTSLSDTKRHLILQSAISDFGKQRIIDHIAFLINIRLAQENGEFKYRNAISIWKKDLAYIRNY